MVNSRTSLSHPLEIGYVDVGAEGGAVGMTLCPGKWQPHGQSGAWDRDLDLDLAAVQTSRAIALVTLMEADELAGVRVAEGRLRATTEALGLEWHHLPIRDTGVPNEIFADRWTYSGRRLRAHLRAGRRIVLHCLGGLGRSGTVAAQLLVELGMDSEEAILAVRAARPGAVENVAQESYVRACHARVESAGAPDVAERALACLLGGAVGDTFGYAIEFERLASIRRRHGPGGLQQPVRERGRLIVSDDTQMTLFTLEGLLRGLDAGLPFEEEGAVQEVRRAYLDWLATQGGGQRAGISGWLAAQPVMRAARAPGNTCLSALRQGGDGTTDTPINNSKGCGAVMRAAPAGLFPRHTDLAAAFRLGARTGALTHGHPSGYLSAGVMAAIVRGLLDGRTLEEAADAARQVLRQYEGCQETDRAIGTALALAATDVTDHAAAVGSLGEGWVGEEALAIGLYAALAGPSFSDAVRIAANHDGDSDSTASIAGQLYGAWRGLGEIPHDWVLDLDVLEPLLHLTRLIEATRA